jgi:hypothetical protein
MKEFESAQGMVEKPKIWYNFVVLSGTFDL